MSFLSLKSKISIFFEQRLDSLDSTRQQLDSNCLMTNPTVSRLTEALDRLDSLDSNLEGMGGNKKPCNTCNSVQEISESELIYPQYTNIAANDQETLKETDPDFYEFLYGKSTEELLYNHLLTCPYCHILRGEYCLYGAELGKAYDALLLNRDDAQARRESLALQVDRARISGRSVYVPF